MSWLPHPALQMSILGLLRGQACTHAMVYVRVVCGSKKYCPVSGSFVSTILKRSLESHENKCMTTPPNAEL